MVRHIVLWRLKGETEEEKQAAAVRVKAALESLNGQIPGMRKLEAGIDYTRTPDSSEIVLYSEFDSREAVAVYQSHPAHKAVVPMILEAICERRVVDYED